MVLLSHTHLVRKARWRHDVVASIGSRPTATFPSKINQSFYTSYIEHCDVPTHLILPRPKYVYPVSPTTPAISGRKERERSFTVFQFCI